MTCTDSIVPSTRPVCRHVHGMFRSIVSYPSCRYFTQHRYEKPLRDSPVQLIHAHPINKEVHFTRYEVQYNPYTVLSTAAPQKVSNQKEEKKRTKTFMTGLYLVRVTRLGGHSCPLYQDVINEGKNRTQHVPPWTKYLTYIVEPNKLHDSAILGVLYSVHSVCFPPQAAGGQVYVRIRPDNPKSNHSVEPCTCIGRGMAISY